jgi:hypothetical protein
MKRSGRRKYGPENEEKKIKHGLDREEEKKKKERDRSKDLVKVQADQSMVKDDHLGCQEEIHGWEEKKKKKNLGLQAQKPKVQPNC